jgi:hypothetical protein
MILCAATCISFTILLLCHLTITEVVARTLWVYMNLKCRDVPQAVSCLMPGQTRWVLWWTNWQSTSDVPRYCTSTNVARSSICPGMDIGLIRGLQFRKGLVLVQDEGLRNVNLILKYMRQILQGPSYCREGASDKLRGTLLLSCPLLFFPRHVKYNSV